MSYRDKHHIEFVIYGETLKKSFDCEERKKFFLRCVELSQASLKTITVQEALDLYLDTESVKKSISSQKTDARILKRLYATIVKEGLIALAEIKAIHLEKHQNNLSKEYKGATVNRDFNTIKHCFKKFVEWEYLRTSPAAYIRALQVIDQPVANWTDQDYKLLLKACNSSQDKLGLMIMWETGARVSSVIKLKVSDIDFNRACIQFKSQKGPYRKAKTYPFPASKTILKEIKKHIKDNNLDDSLFNYSPPTFNKRMQRLIKKTKKLSKNITLHGIRHTFATNLYSEKVPINQIATLLGHSNTKVTEKYILKNLEDLRQVLQKK